MARRSYSNTSRPMLAALQRRGLLDQEAFAAHLESATGELITRQVVSQWVTGDSHLPADVLEHLADFTGRADLVLAPFARASGAHVVVSDPVVAAQGAVLAAIDPAGPRGVAVDATERADLVRVAEDLRAQLDSLLVTLGPPRAVRAS